jgi:V/A-type H+-transporting ATPase subunit G/H
MSETTNIIEKVREAEQQAQEMIQAVEQEIDALTQDAANAAEAMIAKAEEEARLEAKEKMEAQKEQAKQEYKAIVAEEGDLRRDTVETGKSNLDKARKEVLKEFSALFS